MNYEENFRVEVVFEVQKLFIITFYVPSRYKERYFIEKFVDNRSKVIICGDFNIDSFCHSSMGQQFVNII